MMVVMVMMMIIVMIVTNDDDDCDKKIAHCYSCLCSQLPHMMMIINQDDNEDLRPTEPPDGPGGPRMLNDCHAV